MDRITSFPWDFFLISKMLGTLFHWKLLSNWKELTTTTKHSLRVSLHDSQFYVIHSVTTAYNTVVVLQIWPNWLYCEDNPSSGNNTLFCWRDKKQANKWCKWIHCFFIQHPLSVLNLHENKSWKQVWRINSTFVLNITLSGFSKCGDWKKN